MESQIFLRTIFVSTAGITNNTLTQSYAKIQVIFVLNRCKHTFY